MEGKQAGCVCPRCHDSEPRWQCDYRYDELGLEGDGTVLEYHCDRCGIDFVIYEPDGAEPVCVGEK